MIHDYQALSQLNNRTLRFFGGLKRPLTKDEIEIEIFRIAELYSAQGITLSPDELLHFAKQIRKQETDPYDITIFSLDSANGNFIFYLSTVGPISLDWWHVIQLLEQGKAYTALDGSRYIELVGL